jgi:Calcineurin-like phosphoesterase
MNMLTGPTRLLLAGDCHGDIDHVGWLIERAQEKYCTALFVLGDFGYWEHTDGGLFLDQCSDLAAMTGVTIYWLDGNHENHTWLRKRYLTELVPRDEWGFVQIRMGLYHAPRAHRWTWQGRTFMALGGAYSIDKEGRLKGEDRLRRKIETLRTQMDKGHDLLVAPMQLAALQTGLVQSVDDGEHTLWWGEEEISQEEADEAIAGGMVDILLTHDKPLNSTLSWNRKEDEDSKRNQATVQRVVDAVKPRLLAHGHLHFRYEDNIVGPTGTKTHVIGLDCNERNAASPFYRREHSCEVLDITQGVRTCLT